MLPAFAVPAVFLLAIHLTFTEPPEPIMFRVDPAHTGVSSATLFAGQGGVRWRIRTGDAVRSTPAVTATRLFVGSGDGKLYAIDRRAGTVVWTFDAGDAVSASPAVAEGLVVAATRGGRIFAVNEGTGRLAWSFTTGPALPLNNAVAADWDFFASSPVVVGQTVVIGGQDGGVYALDLTSGRHRWRAQTNGRVRATPAIKDGIVVVGSWDGRVYAYDLATGAERWMHKTEGDTLDSSKWGFDRRAIQSSAAISNGVVYVGSRDSGLYGLDFATGTRRFRFSHRGSWVVGSPAVRGDTIYVGSSDGHFIHAVNAEGKELWRLPTVSNVLSSPLLIGDLLVAGAMNGQLLALDAGTGQVRWQLKFDDPILPSPVAADGELYFGTDGGEIVAVGQVNPQPARLAVFYDSSLVGQGLSTGGLLAREYFAGLGYQVLVADSLAGFFEARIRDGLPSAVVFAMDALPKSVAPVVADTVLFRRYLDAGGKVVWVGYPPGSIVIDSTGKIVDLKLSLSEPLLGVPAAGMDFNGHPARPTAAGRRWGLETVGGMIEWVPASVSEALALDEVGKTSAWVKVYRPERPGSGFVQLWGEGVTYQRLPMIRAVTEYGLVRR